MKAHPLIEAAVVEWLQIPRGSKGQLVVQLTQQTGLHEQTVRRQLATLKPGMRTRKRRSDAGKSSVSSDEARMVAAIIEESRRNTGTGQLPMEDALQVARANGLIKAERIDKATGEWVPVSASTMRKELRKHYVHSAQLAASSPAARLSSPHPNYLWQVDASISSQYYLDNDGLKPMPAGEFYPGKPQNMERISKQRLWRYVITDHASGCVEVFYVLGSESAGNLSAALIHAMTRRPNGTMHGVPQRLMADPGSATKSHTTSNLCNALGIKLIVNRVGNARAKGQVENAHYLVETHFEARLALGPKIKTLEEINILAQQWAQAYNATRIHTRTRMTRRAGWLRIESAHLVEAPSIDVLRQLTNSAPKPCVVKDGLIQFRSKTYSVRDIPELLNGARVMVAVNALDAAGSVRIMMQVNGVDTHYIAPCVERDSFGFLQIAAQVDVEFNSPPQTPADAAAKELERIAMDVRTDEEAKAARKAKRVPFGGRIDPMKDVKETQFPPSLPRASVRAVVNAPAVVDLTLPRIDLPEIKREFAPLTHMDAARSLMPLLKARGVEWTAEMMQGLQAAYPEGVPHDQIESCAEQLWQRNRLRLVREAT